MGRLRSESRGIFKNPLTQEIARIEALNAKGTDKAWVHRVMLVRRNHGACVMNNPVKAGGSK